ncbi:Ca2+-binding protein, RTX toxin-related [Monaibacterium marinum]|uniref:Ca2+-binding protein, RTX toxin-related n=1 Tax=Pontivivens marinum TaxID=1690039 RepID=A0A2C9CU01_9RHOB|nr:hypothetical protein [Monaibacterium marinum]SOH94836.1 Ca2+-binding protein, RTX toxin-related [Monaibacterium marinum]
MTSVTSQETYEYLGTDENDAQADGYQNQDGAILDANSDDVSKVNGLEGDDEIFTGDGNNLAAGDMVGDEWSYIDGKWVYDTSAVIVSDYGDSDSFDDTITTGSGNDVLLGNGGDDTLSSGAGADIVNAGRGNDVAFGGTGDDLINLEDGDDYTEAGLGADIVNGGAGDDVIFGDVKGANLLAASDKSATNFAKLAEAAAWSMQDTYGTSTISQSAATVAGETYTISFDLAANLAGGKATGKVEVLWNGEVVDTVEAKTGAYEKFTVDVLSTGDEGELSFRELLPEDSTVYNFDGPIVTYDKTMSFGGETTTVKAFAAGQAKLYQVVDGALKIFDVQAKEYVDAGSAPNFRINSVGFNIDDDLIYGVAKSAGVDSLGNAVATTDIVMIDAAGETYRVGEGFYGDYVGDFDDSGNLWTFHTSLDRISVVDVDQLDANGNPEITYYKFPADMFKDRTYDLAFNAADGSFYAVVSPRSNGAEGKVVKIDVSEVANGGEPTFSEVAITGTLYGDQMEPGMASGAYGAVFMDGESNLYYGLNKGDHDLDSGTAIQGAIFKVNVDWKTGQAYSEFMSEAPSTGSNDGAVDPRSTDAFSEIDADAAVLIREPALTLVVGGNDDLRGGDGKDEMHGNEGDDKLFGGNDDDIIFGDQGNDYAAGGTGNDFASGGSGNDTLRGQAGDDELEGGEGDDQLFGGADQDAVNGDAGNDRLYGGAGADTLNGGTGNDSIWGGFDNDVISGDDGNDLLIGQIGDDQLSGGDGDDQLMGQLGDDQLSGGAGADQLYGGDGNDALNGDSGNDRLFGGAGTDIVNGDEGADSVWGGDGHDALNGDAGNDRLFGGAGADTLNGGDDNDSVWGGLDNDVVSGGNGNDMLIGQLGDDQLSGGAGVDKLVGGTGADVLNGGEGNDHLWGGQWSSDNDADVFVFEGGTGKDYVHDFETANDAIDLSAFDADFISVQEAMRDLGWATVIDLNKLSGGSEGDLVVLKSVDANDLSKENFLLGSDTLEF